ncbi:NADH-quinone oxidoreductase subunit B [Mariniluteicoccus flavus]
MRALDWFGDRSLVVVDIGLACCVLEFDAAGGAAGATEVRPGDRVAVVVSGTVTDALAPVVREIVDAAGESGDARVVSFGACASSGGPYWDSYAVTKGVGQLVPVDVFVPGCPPPPGALADALEGLRVA